MLLSLAMLMLSATQIYTIFTVQLLAVLNPLPVEANIVAYSFTNNTAIFDDLPARFGYQLPSNGLKGFLIGARPENACMPIDPPPGDNKTDAFIALIRRFDCDFDVKVLHAQRAGYKAAIIHNVGANDLISMGSDDVDVMRQIDIPSVFVSEETAISLKEEYYYETGHVALFPSSIWLLASLMFIVGMFFIIIIVRMFEYFCEQRRPRRGRPAKEQVQKLPSRKYKKGDNSDVCVICLEEYEEGDKLRVLPCSHAYHIKCVDRWLASRKTCPVCKQRVICPRSHWDQARDEADGSLDDDSEVSESTPLLHSMASTSTHSVSITSGASGFGQDGESSEMEDDVPEDVSQEELVVVEELVQIQQDLPLE